jgi:hypothetical protein
MNQDDEKDNEEQFQAMLRAEAADYEASKKTMRYAVKAIPPGSGLSHIQTAFSEEEAKALANDQVKVYGYAEAEVYAMDDGGMIINSDQGDCLYYVHQDMDEQRRMPKKPGFFARALNWLKGE